MRNLTAHITKNGLCESYNLFIFELGEIAEKPLCKGKTMSREIIAQQRAELEQKAQIPFLPFSDFMEFVKLYPQSTPVGEIVARFESVNTIKNQYVQLVQNGISILGSIESEWINRGQ